jgi:hypothetical protein
MPSAHISEVVQPAHDPHSPFVGDIPALFDLALFGFQVIPSTTVPLSTLRKVWHPGQHRWP